MGFIVKAVKSVVKAVVGVVSKVVGAVFGFAVGSKTTAKAKATNTLNKSLEPEAYRKIVFGRMASPLDLRFWEVWAANGSRYDEVLASAAHRINAYLELYMENDLAISAAGVVQAKFAGVLSRDTRLGAPGQTAMAVGSGTQWTNTATFDGVPHMKLAWVPDEKKLPNGIPSRYTQVIEGALVYDPRRDSTVPGGAGPHRANDRSTWSYATLDGNGVPIGRNNALQALWYLLGWTVPTVNAAGQVTGEALVAGRGVDPQDINLASFIAGANACEVAGYYTDMVLSTEDTHTSNEDKITCSGLIGRLIDPGGLWSYYANVDDTANIAVELTDADIIQGVTVNWNEYESMSSQFNQVSGKFVNPSPTTLFQAFPYPMVRDATYEANLGIKRRKPQDFEQVLDGVLAQRLARLLLNQGQYQGEFQAGFNYRALKAQAWSVVRYTSERFGFTKLFRVYRHDISTDAGIGMLLKEIDPSIWGAGTVNPPLAPGLGTNYQANQEIPLTGLAVASTIVKSDATNSTVYDAGAVTWDEPPVVVRRTEVRYRVVGSTYWESAAPVQRGGLRQALIFPLVKSTAYEVQARHISINEVEGPWLALAQPFVSGSSGNVDYQGILTSGITAQWPYVGDPMGTRPENNATVGAPAGTNVAGMPAQQLVGNVAANTAGLSNQGLRLDQIVVDINNLEDVYGDTANAAASASAAAASQAAAESYKTAAETARNQSQTARDAAQAAQAAAGGSATDAASSSAAALSALQSSNDAKAAAQAAAQAAGGSASAAAGSATTASNKADAAAGSASTSAGQASIATTKAGEASTSAGQAAQSATDANGSKSSAASSASLAANSVADARNLATDAAREAGNSAASASAAAGSASTASTASTNAQQSAISASGSANTATTKAGEAGGSASAAAGSASSAAGSSSASAQSASAASSSEVSAKTSAASTMPSDFNLDGRFWTPAYTGFPYPLGPEWSFPTKANVGKVAFVSFAAPGQRDIATWGRFAVQKGRKYRVSARAALDYVQGADQRVQVILYAIANNSAYIEQSNQTTYADKTPADGWFDLSFIVDGDFWLSKGWTICIPMLRFNGNAYPQTIVNGMVQYIKIEDVTESSAAAGYASASAASASTAGTKSTEAGNSAAAANQSKLDAQAANGTAQSAASAASGSATTADQRASAAAASASLSATYRDQAGGYRDDANNLRIDAQNAAAASQSSAATADARASAAASSASLSATYRDQSLGYRNDANNLKIDAQNAAAAAQGSAATADARASAASSSASLSATYRDQALGAIAETHPTDMSGGFNYYFTYSGQTVPDFVNYNGQMVARIYNTAGGVVPKWSYPTVLGRTYRVAYEARGDGGGTTPLFVAGTSTTRVPNNSSIDVKATAETPVTANWTRYTADFTITSAYNTPYTVFWFAGAPNNGSAWYYRYFSVEDVTSQLAASASASAANSSAATASAAAASASSSSLLAASIGLNSVTPNPTYANYPNNSGPPAGWGDAGHGAAAYKVSGIESPNAYRFNTEADGSYWALSMDQYNLSPGWYVIDVTVRNIAGNWVAAGVLLEGLNEYGGAGYGAASLRFATDPDQTGAVQGAPGVNGRVYRFSKLVQMNDGNLKGIRVWQFSNFTAWGNASLYIEWHRCSLRPATQAEIQNQMAITSLQASVSSNSSALVTLQGRALAYWQQVVNAGAAGAFIEARAESSFGAGATSTVSIGAREVHIYNQVATLYQKALSIQSGNVIIYGNLTAAGGIFLGNGNIWRVQYQSKYFAASDGQNVPFGADLGNVPKFVFLGDNLAPLAANETYKLYADQVSSTGFIPRLRIATPGAASSYNLTNDTVPGGVPTRQIDKAGNPDSTNNVYNLTFSGTVRGYAYNNGTQ